MTLLPVGMVMPLMVRVLLHFLLDLVRKVDKISQHNDDEILLRTFVSFVRSFLCRLSLKVLVLEVAS